MTDVFTNLRRAIGRIPGARIGDEYLFDSGAASISVEAGDRMFGLDYSPRDGSCIV